MRGDLHRYFFNNAHKPLHKWMHYFDIYERHFERFRGKSPVMLEIGVFGGGSLAMWKDYFGPGCKIVGVDINPECKIHECQDIEIFIGSQDDPSLLDRIKSKYRHIDIVLDDGSHIMQHMVSTFDLLFDFVDENGVYLVEDTHTCYWEEYQGGLGRAGSFIEFAKAKIDDLHATQTRGAVPASNFTRSTSSVTFYDSVIVFEKQRQGVRQTPMTQPM